MLPLLWQLSFCLSLIPIMTLVLYPLSQFQKCLARIPQRWQIALHYFVDSFQGCYRDGTEPKSKDCRWFSVVPFVLRLAIFRTYSGIFYYHSFFGRIIIWLLLLTSILTIILEPTKSEIQVPFRSLCDLSSFHSSCHCLQEMGDIRRVTATVYAIITPVCVLHQIYFFVWLIFWIKTLNKTTCT